MRFDSFPPRLKTINFPDPFPASFVSFYSSSYSLFIVFFSFFLLPLFLLILSFWLHYPNQPRLPISPPSRCIFFFIFSSLSLSPFLLLNWPFLYFISCSFIIFLTLFFISFSSSFFFSPFLLLLQLLFPLTHFLRLHHNFSSLSSLYSTVSSFLFLHFFSSSFSSPPPPPRTGRWGRRDPIPGSPQAR